MPRIIHLDETTSTNDHLSALLKYDFLAEGSIVWADWQSSGKGQVENTWESERGKNLTFSLVFYPNFLAIEEQFILSKITSLALVQTLQELQIADVSIKWPNDIYVGKKKIAGILIENTLSNSQLKNTVIGIGLNVNQEHFHSNAPNPLSLTQITGLNYHLEDILKKIASNLYALYVRLLKGEESFISQEYFNALFRRSGSHLYEAEEIRFEAKIHSVLLNGSLMLENIRTGELRSFCFKEVKFIL